MGIHNDLDFAGAALCCFMIGRNDSKDLMIGLTSKVPSTKNFPQGILLTRDKKQR